MSSSTRGTSKNNDTSFVVTCPSQSCETASTFYKFAAAAVTLVLPCPAFWPLASRRRPLILTSSAQGVVLLGTSETAVEGARSSTIDKITSRRRRPDKRLSPMPYVFWLIAFSPPTGIIASVAVALTCVAAPVIAIAAEGASVAAARMVLCAVTPLGTSRARPPSPSLRSTTSLGFSAKRASSAVIGVAKATPFSSSGTSPADNTTLSARRPRTHSRDGVHSFAVHIDPLAVRLRT